MGRRVTFTILGNIDDIPFDLNAVVSGCFLFVCLIGCLVVCLFVCLFEWLVWPMACGCHSAWGQGENHRQIDCFLDSFSEGTGLRPIGGLLPVEVNEVWDLSESCLQ